MERYSRVFITLTQDRAGYASRGREPSGRAVIEVKDGQGKITVTAQDLKREIIYKAYIVCSEHSERAVRMGSLRADERGKTELKWEFDPADVGHTGLPIAKFDVVVVVVYAKSETAWVLTGYRNGEVRFKDKFRVYAEPEKTDAAPQSPSGQARPQDTQPRPAAVDTQARQSQSYDEPVYEATKPQPFAEPEFEAAQAQSLAEPVYETTKPHSVSEQNQEDTADPAEYEMRPLSIRFDDEEASAPPPPGEQAQAAHTQFNTYAQKFNKELEELENLMLGGEGHDASRSLDAIMAQNIPMSPFRSGFEDVTWIKLSLRELAHLPHNCWQLANDPYVNLAFGHFKHLMLGARPCGHDVHAPRRCYLALPDQFDPARERHAKRLGFDLFRPCDNIVDEYRESSYGYWLMEFDW